jgi:hypothetical protein
MSFSFSLDENKLAEQLSKIFSDAELEISKSASLFDLEDQRLELLIRNVPMHQAHYQQYTHEMKACIKWLENYKSKLEAQALKNISSTNNRAFSATDQKTLIAGTRDIIEINQLIIETTLLYGKFDAITEAFKTMSWMLGHITKLRVSELQDVMI